MVVPLLEMALAVLICISTPVDTFNFYSLMFDMMNPDTGENVFITYALDLICDMCKPRPDAEKCTHKLKYIPPWKDVAKLNTGPPPCPRAARAAHSTHGDRSFADVWGPNLDSEARVEGCGDR